MSAPEGFPAEFDRIEAAVDAGQTDLRSLGFWRLLAKVKADPALSRHWAEQAGRIDRKAFEARVHPRFPVWFGNAVLLLGGVAGAFAVGVALGTTSETLAGMLLLFAAGAWTVAFHSPTHWIVGRLAGIRFTGVLHGRSVPSPAGTQDGLRDLPGRLAGRQGVDACLRGHRDEAGAVRRARVLAGDRGTGVGRMRRSWRRERSRS